MKKVVKVIGLAVLVAGIMVSCASQNNQAQGSERGGRGQQRGQGEQRGGAPTFEQLLARMDANKDGKLAQSEIKGPLKDDFSKIDTDEDGFISEEEFDNAPKPERGQGGGQRR